MRWTGKHTENLHLKQLTLTSNITIPVGLASPLLFAGIGVAGAGIAVKGGSQISDYVIGKGQKELVVEQIQLDRERTINLLCLDEDRRKLARHLSEIEQVWYHAKHLWRQKHIKIRCDEDKFSC